MKIPLPSKQVLKPSFVSMAAMFASFAAWLFPSFGVLRKGFNYPARLDFNSFVVLACWYLLIFLSFSIGEKAGRLIVFRKPMPGGKLFDLQSNFLYFTFSALSTIGVITTLVRIFQTLSLQQAVIFITLGQANSLKEALYEDYSVGLVSLRYLVLFSGSIALYRIIRWKSYRVINVFNAVLLLLCTLLSSRLIFIATLLTTVFLLAHDKRKMSISALKMIVVATCLFLILSILNFTRNKDYYDVNKLSFAEAGISEILAYLGSPFQAAIGSAGVTDQLVAGGDQTYRDYVDEEITLNTNSAFVHLHEQMGYVSWLYVAGLCLFMGLLFESLASFGKTIFLLPCGAILYGSAELWRLDLFHQGMFIVWIVMGIGLPVFLIGCQRLFRFLAGDDGIAEAG
jgi:hypothetical protein